jgi:hypothetical protein
VTGEEFIKQFEAGAISNHSFHHADHIQLAFGYLEKYSMLNALQRFSCALKKFAAANDKKELYHETITCAYFFLIHERMASSGNTNWAEFANNNPDLFIWKDGILSRYYRDTTLKSELARKVFVLPDKSLETQGSVVEVAAHKR